MPTFSQISPGLWIVTNSTELGGQRLSNNFTEINNRIGKSNYSGTLAPPTSSTDSSSGWSVGSRIIASDNILYICQVSTPGAAIWNSNTQATRLSLSASDVQYGIGLGPDIGNGTTIAITATWNSGGNSVRYLIDKSGKTSLNPFDQDCSTSSSPTFAGLTLNGTVIDNPNGDPQMYLNGQGHFVHIIGIFDNPDSPTTSFGFNSGVWLIDQGSLQVAYNVACQSLTITGALADGTYSCGTGSITITNGAITEIS